MIITTWQSTNWSDPTFQSLIAYLCMMIASLSNLSLPQQSTLLPTEYSHLIGYSELVYPKSNSLGPSILLLLFQLSSLFNCLDPVVLFKLHLLFFIRGLEIALWFILFIYLIFNYLLIRMSLRSHLIFLSCLFTDFKTSN